VAPVSLDGQPIHDAPVAAVAEASTPAASTASGAADKQDGSLWRQTRYEAIQDAAAGVVWPREQAGPKQWTTQLERIGELAEVLGLKPVEGETVASRERISRSLGLPLVVLNDAKASFEKAGGYRTRGEVLVRTLAKVGRGPRILERILRAGALAGRWGTVHFWRLGAKGTPPSRQLFPGLGMPDG
jgi:hypothetical protein